jgi:RNA polymerase sigma-70 factor (ECF subfamily)
MINKVYIEYLLLKDDKKAFDQIISIIQPKLLSFATNILKDKSIAQDAVQDSLINIIKGVSKLKDHKNFHAWIYQVTRNKCLDIIRKNKKYKKDCDLDAVAEPHSKASNHDEQQDMARMIRQLPPKQQNIIQLFYYDGFTVREIAGILTIPPGTIKALLFESRGYLKQLFGE